MKHTYGIIGFPLTHSFSPNYFNNKFKKLRLYKHEYKKFEIENIYLIEEILKKENNLKGFAITIPYKTEIIEYLDSKNSIVEDINACNCVKIEDGKLLGFNTDVLGFELSVKKQLQPHHDKALILGSGGGAKAVSYVLKKNNIKFKYVSQNKSNEQFLAYSDLSQEIIKEHRLIINTTPLGMYPNTDQFPIIPYNFLNNTHLCYDLIYNPEKTKFLELSEKNNANIKNGYEMLVLQAEEIWKIWNS